MTTTHDAPHFTVRSGFSTARGVFIAALCAFIVTAFLIDVQHGTHRHGAAETVEQRT
jgi:hypothetical protein